MTVDENYVSLLVERHSVNLKSIIDDHNAINEHIYQNQVTGVLSKNIAPHGPYICKGFDIPII